MPRIAITGAAGRVGRQALAALPESDVTPLTHGETEDLDDVVLDVTDRERFTAVLADHDVLVHLAANPSPEAAWEELREVNVDGVYNAYEAAVANDLDRVVFASTNHVVNMHNVANPADGETETTREHPRIVDVDRPPRPDSPYGVSKVAGEAFGSLYADRHGLDVLNLRIGWLMSEDDLRESQDAPAAQARFARAMWLSERDCRNALAASATAPVPESPLTLNVVSRNDDRFLPISRTQQAIGYEPRDNANEVVGE